MKRGLFYKGAFYGSTGLVAEGSLHEVMPGLPVDLRASNLDSTWLVHVPSRYAGKTLYSSGDVTACLVASPRQFRSSQVVELDSVHHVGGSENGRDVITRGTVNLEILTPDLHLFKKDRVSVVADLEKVGSFYRLRLADDVFANGLSKHVIPTSYVLDHYWSMNSGAFDDRASVGAVDSFWRPNSNVRISGKVTVTEHPLVREYWNEECLRFQAVVDASSALVSSSSAQLSIGCSPLGTPTGAPKWVPSTTDDGCFLLVKSNAKPVFKVES